MATVALTGHTRGLGATIHKILIDNHHHVLGFSLSGGCDLRDYDQVGKMIEQVQDYDWFINCAKPDYAQAQILYRLISLGFSGRVLNIGSPVVHKDPGWRDLGLLEYATQKTALYHAYRVLNGLYPNKLFIWEPNHIDNADYVADGLARFNL